MVDIEVDCVAWNLAFAKIRGDRLRDFRDSEFRRVFGLDELEGFFDLGEEAFVVH